MLKRFRNNENKDYEISQKVASCRHKHTGYDGNDDFFNEFMIFGETGRKKLNCACFDMCYGEMNEYDFKSCCHKIVAEVSLFRKCNRKRFIRAVRDNLGQRMPYASPERINKMADKYCWIVLKSQTRRNAQRNLCIAY